MIKLWCLQLNYAPVSDWPSKGALADPFPAPKVQTQVPKLMYPRLKILATLFNKQICWEASCNQIFFSKPHIIGQILAQVQSTTANPKKQLKANQQPYQLLKISFSRTQDPLLTNERLGPQAHRLVLLGTYFNHFGVLAAICLKSFDRINAL